MARKGSRKTPRKELTPYERGRIVGLAEAGMRVTEIARHVNRPKSTISATQRKTSIHDNGESITRFGRPKKYAVRDERHILLAAKRDPFITWKELLQLTPICRTQTYLMLKSFNIKNWLAKGRPLLTKQQARERLLWARRHRNGSWRK